MVHTRSFRRWVLICMIVLRVVVGDGAHAMHQSEATAAKAVMAGQQSEHCAEHMSPHAESDEPSNAVTQATGHEHGKTDCCKTSACTCACVHGSAMPTLSVSIFDSPSHFIEPPPVLGRVQSRFTPLLRPPA